MCPWVGPHAPSVGRQLRGLPSRVEYLLPPGKLLPLVYGTTASPLWLGLRGLAAWQATPSWTVYRLACHRLLPWLLLTFAMVPDAAWPGSDQWPWGTAPVTGPVGRLGGPSASDPWGIGSFLSLGRPTCAGVCGVLGHSAPVRRLARSVSCVACAASLATWLPFTGVPARCVALCVRCHRLLAPVRGCARSVHCFTTPPAVTHTLCALSELRHFVLMQESGLTVPPTVTYSTQETASIRSYEVCRHLRNAQMQLPSLQFFPKTIFAVEAFQLAPPAHAEFNCSAHSASLTLQLPVHGTPSSAVSPTLDAQTPFVHFKLTFNPMLLFKELNHNWPAYVNPIFTQSSVVCSGPLPLDFALRWLSNHRNDVSPSSFPAVVRLSHQLLYTQHADSDKCLKLRLLHGLSLWFTINGACGLRFASYAHLNFSLAVIFQLHLIRQSGVNYSDTKRCCHINPLRVLRYGASKKGTLTTADTAPCRLLNCSANRLRPGQLNDTLSVFSACPNAACGSSQLWYHSETIFLL